MTGSNLKRFERVQHLVQLQLLVTSKIYNSVCAWYWTDKWLHFAHMVLVSCTISVQNMYTQLGCNLLSIEPSTIALRQRAYMYRHIMTPVAIHSTKCGLWPWQLCSGASCNAAMQLVFRIVQDKLPIWSVYG